MPSHGHVLTQVTVVVPVNAEVWSSSVTERQMKARLEFGKSCVATNDAPKDVRMVG